MEDDRAIRNRAWSAVDLIVAAVLLLGLGYVYLGFFRSDPRMARSVKILLWGIRILYPFAAAGILALYRGVKRGRVKAASLGVLGFGVFFALLLAYPVVSQIYARSFRKNIAGYHPYLQLAPNDLALRPASPGERPYRIFCLGGSTTEFKDKEGRGWPERLEARLQGAVPGRRVEVYNAGRQWYTTEHLLIDYATRLRPLAPDMIIVMEAINDLLQNADFSAYSFGTFRPDYGHFHGPAYRLIRRPTLEELTLRLLRSMWYHRPRKVVDTDVFPGLAAFERNLIALIDLARAGGADVVLMTQPSLFKEGMTAEEEAVLVMVRVEAVGPTRQWSIATARRGMDAYNSVVRELAGRRSCLLIDLEKSVPKTLDYFWDDVHYLGPGFDRVAESAAAGLPAGVFGAGR